MNPLESLSAGPEIETSRRSRNLDQEIGAQARPEVNSTAARFRQTYLEAELSGAVGATFRGPESLSAWVEP